MISVPERRRSGRWLAFMILLVALVAGIGLGLLVSWQWWPVEYIDVAPDSLKPTHRQEYILLISMAYAYDRDLELAQARLAGLGDPTATGPEVVTLAERYAAQGGNEGHIRALTALAYALGHYRAMLAAYLSDVTPTVTWTPHPTAVPTATATLTFTPTMTPTPTPTVTPAPTATHTALPREPLDASPTTTATLVPEATGLRPTATLTPIPTRTPTSTPTEEPRFRVVEQRRTCEGPVGQLMVTVLDADGQPKPNVELFVRWSGGDDHFFTGLKPEIGAGHADFAMERGETYQVEAAVQSDVAQGIVADACEGEGHLASWYIVFQWSGEATP